MLKKTVSVLLAAILLLSVFSVTSFAYSYETAANVAKNISSVSSIRDDMILIQTRLKDSVPYQIRKGTYYESSSDKTGTAVYVVSLTGVDFKEFNPASTRSIITAIRATVNDKTNPYYKKVKDCINNNVPSGSKLIFIGHSLGGMTAQMLAADNDLKKTYEIKHTVALGAPYIITGTKEGSLIRIVDKLDPVPWLSIAGIASTFGDVARETSWKLNPHDKSYIEGSCWAGYDFLGQKGVGAHITLDSKYVIQ